MARPISPPSERFRVWRRHPLKRSDILVGSRTVKEHKQHLREVFTRLRENCLTVNLEKCTLAQPTVTFLSHTVDSEGIRPLPEKVSAIKQFPP